MCMRRQTEEKCICVGGGDEENETTWVEYSDKRSERATGEGRKTHNEKRAVVWRHTHTDKASGE